MWPHDYDLISFTDILKVEKANTHDRTVNARFDPITGTKFFTITLSPVNSGSFRKANLKVYEDGIAYLSVSGLYDYVNENALPINVTYKGSSFGNRFELMALKNVRTAVKSFTDPQGNKVTKSHVTGNCPVLVLNNNVMFSLDGPCQLMFDLNSKEFLGIGNNAVSGFKKPVFKVNVPDSPARKHNKAVISRINKYLKAESLINPDKLSSILDKIQNMDWQLRHAASTKSSDLLQKAMVANEDIYDVVMNDEVLQACFLILQKHKKERGYNCGVVPYSYIQKMITSYQNKVTPSNAEYLILNHGD